MVGHFTAVSRMQNGIFNKWYEHGGGVLRRRTLVPVVADKLRTPW